VCFWTHAVESVPFYSLPDYLSHMAFEEDETVVMHDEHSEYDGEVGTVTRVMETMFGDATYTVQFEEGQEQGVPEDALEAAPDEEVSSTESDDEEDVAEADDESDN